MLISICPDALVALRTGRQGILLAQKPEIGDGRSALRSQEASLIISNDRFDHSGEQTKTLAHSFFSTQIKGFAS
jgi:hypothetical protein